MTDAAPAEPKSPLLTYVLVALSFLTGSTAVNNCATRRQVTDLQEELRDIRASRERSPAAAPPGPERR